LILGKILKTKIFQQNNSTGFIFLVILLTLIFNGYLTARPIVTYNNFLKTNLNIYTVPLEDVIYGLALIFWVIMIYEKLIENKKNDQARTA
jgi:lycopene cyclase domain-containing protein